MSLRAVNSEEKLSELKEEIRGLAKEYFYYPAPGVTESKSRSDNRELPVYDTETCHEDRGNGITCTYVRSYVYMIETPEDELLGAWEKSTLKAMEALKKELEALIAVQGYEKHGEAVFGGGRADANQELQTIREEKRLFAEEHPSLSRTRFKGKGKGKATDA